MRPPAAFMPPDEAWLRQRAEAKAILRREQARRWRLRVLEGIRADLEVALANVKA
jgi:hypothetical protein